MQLPNLKCNATWLQNELVLKREAALVKLLLGTSDFSTPFKSYLWVSSNMVGSVILTSPLGEKKNCINYTVNNIFKYLDELAVK